MTARRAPGHATGPITDSRRIGAEICADLRNGELLDASFERHSATLDARDRRWTLELVAGMLRRRGWLDAVLTGCVTGGLARLDPDLIDLLRLGAHQLLGMDRVPAYAAIAQTVELAKQRHGRGAAGLVNAVLRRLDRERATIAPTVPGDPVDALAQTYSHPRWLVARWIARWGAEETERLLAANNTVAPLVVRPYGVVAEQLEAMLDASDVAVEHVPLVRDSLQLGTGVSLTELGAFRQGRLFVQDPAATLVVHYADIPAGARVLDVCAAPGGKALELSRTASIVHAADRSASRAERIRDNVRRVEATNIEVHVADAREPALRDMDVVLVDAPCTGTGTFRRHPDARWRLRISDLAVMGAAQRSILSAAADAVAPGGLLIYSTCSLEPEENDAQVERLLAERSDFVLEPPSPGAVPATVLDAGRLRVLPQRHGHDGAFAARLRRLR